MKPPKETASSTPNGKTNEITPRTHRGSKGKNRGRRRRSSSNPNHGSRGTKVSGQEGLNNHYGVLDSEEDGSEGSSDDRDTEEKATDPGTGNLNTVRVGKGLARVGEKGADHPPASKNTSKDKPPRADRLVPMAKKTKDRKKRKEIATGSASKGRSGLPPLKSSLATLVEEVESPELGNSGAAGDYSATGTNTTCGGTRQRHRGGKQNAATQMHRANLNDQKALDDEREETRRTAGAKVSVLYTGAPAPAGPDPAPFPSNSSSKGGAPGRVEPVARQVDFSSSGLPPDESVDELQKIMASSMGLSSSLGDDSPLDTVGPAAPGVGVDVEDLAPEGADTSNSARHNLTLSDWLIKPNINPKDGPEEGEEEGALQLPTITGPGDSETATTTGIQVGRMGQNFASNAGGTSRQGSAEKGEQGKGITGAPLDKVREGIATRLEERGTTSALGPRDQLGTNGPDKTVSREGKAANNGKGRIGNSSPTTRHTSPTGQ